MELINKTLELIESQIGLKLELCDYFTGLRKHLGKEYFNVILKDRLYMSKEFQKLEMFSNKTKLITIEPNGINRVAIYPNID